MVERASPWELQVSVGPGCFGAVPPVRTLGSLGECGSLIQQFHYYKGMVDGSGERGE